MVFNFSLDATAKTKKFIMQLLQKDRKYDRCYRCTLPPPPDRRIVVCDQTVKAAASHGYIGDEELQHKKLVMPSNKHCKPQMLK